MSISIKRFRNYSWWCKNKCKTYKPTNQTKKKQPSKTFLINAGYGCLGEKGPYFPWELRYYCLLPWVLSSWFLHSEIFSGGKENFSGIVLCCWREGSHMFFPFPGLTCLTEQCSLLHVCPLYNILQECFQTHLEMRERTVLPQKSCFDTADKVCCITRNVITDIEVVCF